MQRFGKRGQEFWVILILSVIVMVLFLDVGKSIAQQLGFLCKEEYGCVKTDQKSIEDAKDKEAEKAAEKIAACLEKKCSIDKFTVETETLEKERILHILRRDYSDKLPKGKNWDFVVKFNIQDIIKGDYQIEYANEGYTESCGLIAEGIYVYKDIGKKAILQQSEKDTISILGTKEDSTIVSDISFSYLPKDPKWDGSDLKIHTNPKMYIFFDKEYKGWDSKFENTDLSAIKSAITVFYAEDSAKKEEDWKQLSEANYNIEIDKTENKPHIVINTDFGKKYLIEFNRKIIVGKAGEKINYCKGVIKFETENKNPCHLIDVCFEEVARLTRSSVQHVKSKMPKDAVCIISNLIAYTQNKDECDILDNCMKRYFPNIGKCSEKEDFYQWRGIR